MNTMQSCASYYLSLLENDTVMQKVLCGCAMALRLDDDVGRSVAAAVGGDDRSEAIVATMKQLNCVWLRWDGAWYLADDVRASVYRRRSEFLDVEEESAIRQVLREAALTRVEKAQTDGQISAYRKREAKLDASFQTLLSPRAAQEGARGLVELWTESDRGGRAATARVVDNLAPELEEALEHLPVEVVFLQGMAAWERDDKRDQRKYFGAVWRGREESEMAAIAAHLYGLVARDQEVAERAFRDSIAWRSDPSDRAEVYHSLANLLRRDQNRWYEAEQAFEESYDLRLDDPHRAQVLNSWAQLLAESDEAERLREAERMLQRVLQLTPQHLKNQGIVHRTLAQVYEKLGEPLRAIEQLELLRANNDKLGISAFRGIIERRIRNLRAVSRLGE